MKSAARRVQLSPEMYVCPMKARVNTTWAPALGVEAILCSCRAPRSIPAGTEEWRADLGCIHSYHEPLERSQGFVCQLCQQLLEAAKAHDL